MHILTTCLLSKYLKHMLIEFGNILIVSPLEIEQEFPTFAQALKCSQYSTIAPIKNHFHYTYAQRAGIGH